MPILVFFVIFAVWLMYEIKKSNKKSEQKYNDFLEEEHKANSVRKQNIDNLAYLTIPYDTLPFDENAAPPIATYQNKLLALKEQCILNLTGYTNTELKLQYGAPNLELLTEYDTNFTTLARNLARWGDALYEQERLTEAKQVLEYGIQIQTDVSSNYITLARIYLMEERIDDIYALMEQAGSLKTLMKDSIIKQLQQLLSETDA